MKTKVFIVAMLSIAFFALCSFTKHKTSSAISHSKDGYMAIYDTLSDGNYCVQSTEESYIFDKDSLILPVCRGFAAKFIFPVDSGKLVIKDSATGQYRCNFKIVHLPDSIPFFFRKGIFAKVSISTKQQKHFDAFKKRLLQSVKDTALGPALWYELSSVESAMKRNDIISYTIGIRQLNELWAKADLKQYEGLH